MVRKTFAIVVVVLTLGMGVVGPAQAFQPPPADGPSLPPPPWSGTSLPPPPAFPPPQVRAPRCSPSDCAMPRSVRPMIAR